MTYTPAQGKEPLRKDLQGPLFPQAGKRSSQEVTQASLLQGTTGLSQAKNIFSKNIFNKYNSKTYPDSWKTDQKYEHWLLGNEWDLNIE